MPEDGANKKKKKKREKNPEIVKRNLSLKEDKANLSLEQRKETVLQGTKWDPKNPAPEKKLTPKIVAKKITRSPPGTTDTQVQQPFKQNSVTEKQNSVSNEENKVGFNSPSLKRRDSISSQVRRRMNSGQIGGIENRNNYEQLDDSHSSVNRTPSQKNNFIE